VVARGDSRSIGRTLVVAVVVLIVCRPAGNAKSTPIDSAARAAVTLRLTSSAFENGASMPSDYTADGKDASPPLAWSGAPSAVRSFALIVDDPDAPDPRAPKRTFVHWVVYDLPPATTALAAGASSGGLPAGTREGRNDVGRARYTGPAPPIGRHRYFFKLYALDVTLGNIGQVSKADLLKAMEGHVLGQAELIGTYQRK
jgi:Raf kinase inhibitor-like YbhB/YbcL family protein